MSAARLRAEPDVLLPELEALLTSARKARADLKMLTIERQGFERYRLVHYPAWNVDKRPRKLVLVNDLTRRALVNLLTHPEQLNA